MAILNVMLHDDWEINGDGSGDIYQLMFDKAPEILNICNHYGAKYTFFAEFGQQLAMRNSNIQKFKEYAQKWEEILKQAIKQGHDVQLHLHPQWIGATLENEQWQLDFEKWSIASLEQQEIHQELGKGIEYFKEIFCPENKEYQVVAFRAGSWMAQPSKNLICALCDLGILADVTVVKNLQLRGQLGSVDFSKAPSCLLPWQADTNDVAQSGKSSLMCIPTYNEEIYLPLIVFEPLYNLSSIWYHLKKMYLKRKNKNKYKFVFVEKKIQNKDFFHIKHHKLIQKIFSKRNIVLDFGLLHYKTIYKMLLNIAQQCKKSDLCEIPIILLTHSKALHSFPKLPKKNLDNLLKCISKNKDLAFATTQKTVMDLHQAHRKI